MEEKRKDRQWWMEARKREEEGENILKRLIVDVKKRKEMG